MQPEQRGIMPRALDQVFSALQSKTDCEWKVGMTLVEVYRETVRDLLSVSQAARDGHKTGIVVTEKGGVTQLKGVVPAQVENMQVCGHFSSVKLKQIACMACVAFDAWATLHAMHLELQ